MKRSSGILCAISSLPGKYGIGCFSKEAYEFVDWLEKAGQSYWQILPLTTTGEGNEKGSPYTSFSAFAGNPYLIDLESLIEENLLTKEECDQADMECNNGRIDYDKLRLHRIPLLRKAYERSKIYKNEEYQAFIKENNWWLADYALFMAIHGFFKDEPWYTWPEDIRMQWSNAIDYYNEKLYYDIEFHKFLQFTFKKQWDALKEYAHKHGIQIIGDMPIYVSYDSADVWSHPELFQLNEDNKPIAIAGCPPDGFSATGQIWGNPLYNWNYLKQSHYDWWISRIWKNFQLFDVLRIDHFRGFDAYYSIPADSNTALNGHWEKGPGIQFFMEVEQRLGKKECIAEDLGLITDSVRKMVKDSGYPNMKVLHFAFDFDPKNDYLPYNYDKNCVAYTGTHDNDTSIGWYSSLNEKEQQAVLSYLGKKEIELKEVPWALIRLLFESSANTCIIPLQDILGLDGKARMNLPASKEGNWGWRMEPNSTTETLAKKCKDLTILYGRNQKSEN